MKNSNVYQTILLVAVLVGIRCSCIAQNTAMAKEGDFLMAVESRKNEIKLTCLEGCTWKELKFESVLNEPHAVDQFGLTKLPGETFNPGSTESKFLFTIVMTDHPFPAPPPFPIDLFEKKNARGIRIVGKKGMVATGGFAFGCKGGCFTGIYKNGMTDIKRRLLKG